MYIMQIFVLRKAIVNCDKKRTARRGILFLFCEKTVWLKKDALDGT